MWKPREGTKPVEPEKGFFWKPSKPGDAFIGILKQIRAPRRYEDQTAMFSPAVVIGVGSEDGPVLHESAGLNLNSWLEKLVKPAMLEHPVGVVYEGNTDTPKGKMRTFKVYPLADDEWKEVLDSAKASQGEDDLPF